MEQNRWMSLLGLANRARKIISGEELVIKEVRKGRAKLVILSRDASENTSKKITDKCTIIKSRSGSWKQVHTWPGHRKGCTG